MENKPSWSDRVTAGAAAIISVTSLAAAALALGLLALHIWRAEMEMHALQKFTGYLPEKLDEKYHSSHQIAKRDVGEVVSDDQAESLLNQLSLADLAGIRGPPGLKGQDGKDGRDGENGRDGRDGKDGENGRDGRDCENGQELTVLTQILEELRSRTELSPDTQSDESQNLMKILNSTLNMALAQQDGVVGPPGSPGKDGRDGRDGRDGEDGKDGSEMLSQQSLLKNLSGSSYIRWGRTTCPETSELIYKGFSAGQWFAHSGGASNRVCLPLDPEWSTYTTANDQGNAIYGTEYETNDGIFSGSLKDQNVPCANCYSTGRVTTLMIPAKRSCPDDTWTKEYEGYLMTENHSHQASTPYLCVDADAESIDSLEDNKNGATLYLVQAHCDTLGHCPPYISYAELTCGVY